MNFSDTWIKENRTRLDFRVGFNRMQEGITSKNGAKWKCSTRGTGA